jgi:glutamate N-acetyltransferase / amino-acid N-acetyltransferase
MIPVRAGAGRSTKNAAANNKEAYMNGGKEAAYTVPGFIANGIHVGIKASGLKDLALIFSSVPSKVTGVFTTNCFKAAPAVVSQERIKGGVAQAILANSGNANAASGMKGYQDAIYMSRLASERLHIKEDHVLVASTGIIGHHLPIEKIEAGMDRLVKGLRKDGIPDAEKAIMTTDKFPKMAFRKAKLGSREVTICGIAKGAGMIEPHMATMLAFIMTDVNIDLPILDRLFREAVDVSFNSITVDGCMSTNDTAVIMANGMAENQMIKGPSKSLSLFKEMLFNIMTDLSEAMVKDGEGATKIIEVQVEEAKSTGDAKKIAYAIANSNLVKTAIFGRDPNWGRILSAAGSTGISIPVDPVKLYFGDVPVYADGQGIYGREKELVEIMELGRIRIIIKLGMGKKAFRVLASDLSFDYITINAQYHT